jgi:hypothetical protein
MKLASATLETARRLQLIRATGELGALGRLGQLGEAMPKFAVTTAQLESKFKHAKAFGVLENRGKPGFHAFEQRLREFLADPTTTRIRGTYRGKRAILSYSERSRLVVVQSEDGAFASGWRMTSRQVKFVVEKGRLGGD